jgi:hypothetical protein
MNYKHIFWATLAAVVLFHDASECALFVLLKAALLPLQSFCHGLRFSTETTSEPSLQNIVITEFEVSG